MGSHLLPMKQHCHLRLLRHRRGCRLCHTEALGEQRHMLLECAACASLRDEFSPLVAELSCSGVMVRLVWARRRPMVSRSIIAGLDIVVAAPSPEIPDGLAFSLQSACSAHAAQLQLDPSSKTQIYRDIKVGYGCEPYIQNCSNRYLRRSVAQFRTGSH